MQSLLKVSNAFLSLVLRVFSWRGCGKLSKSSKIFLEVIFFFQWQEEVVVAVIVL